MMSEEDIAKIEEVQRIIIRDLAETEWDDDDLSEYNEENPKEMYVAGYLKGYMTALNSAEKAWKEKAMMYDELCK